MAMFTANAADNAFMTIIHNLHVHIKLSGQERMAVSRLSVSHLLASVRLKNISLDISY